MGNLGQSASRRGITAIAWNPDVVCTLTSGAHHSFSVWSSDLVTNSPIDLSRTQTLGHSNHHSHRGRQQSRHPGLGSSLCSRSREGTDGDPFSRNRNLTLNVTTLTSFFHEF